MKTVEYYFNVSTSNGCREMTLERFKEAIRDRDKEIKDKIGEMIEKGRDNWDENLPYRGGYIKALTELLNFMEEK